MEDPVVAIKMTLAMILAEMDDTSQYSDFADDFALIEDAVSDLPRSHPVHNSWLALFGAIYVAKGHLESVRTDIEEMIAGLS